MSFRGGRGGALRIGSGVGGFVGERGVTDAVAFALERGESGRGDRAGGIAGNAGRVDRNHDDAGQKRRPGRLAGGGGQILDAFDEAMKRETLARAGRADDAGQEGGLRLPDDAELGQRPNGLGRILEIRAIAGVGIAEPDRARGAEARSARSGGAASCRAPRRAENAPQSIVQLAFDQRSLLGCRRRAATNGVAR